MAVLNVLYQDMRQEVLDYAKKVCERALLTLSSSMRSSSWRSSTSTKRRRSLLIRSGRNSTRTTVGDFATPWSSAHVPAFERFLRAVTETWLLSSLSALLTRSFDRSLGESWNCIVGKNFGSHVIHQTEGYLFCSYRDEISILLWKSS